MQEIADSAGTCVNLLLPNRSNSAALSSPTDRIRFVLVRTSHPGNIGAAARAIRTMKLDETKALNDRLQSIESEADRLILDLYRDTYINETDPVRFLLRKDMFEILEKAIDRCREAGVVAYQIVLKNS